MAICTSCYFLFAIEITLFYIWGMETFTFNSNAAMSLVRVGIHEPTGLYVRDDGYVLTRRGVWSLGTLNKNLGYYRYTFNHKQYYIHRLVAETFLKNPNNLPCVDHINRIRSDNRLANLRFVTYSENISNSERYINKPYVVHKNKHTDYSVMREKQPERYAEILRRNRESYQRLKHNNPNKWKQRMQKYAENAKIRRSKV